MGATGIEWTDRTWNPVVGCTKVSPGCKNCYAKTLHDQRHKAFHEGKAVPSQYKEPFETVQLMPHRLTEPLSWRKPQRIFVNSVSDLFHEDVPFAFLDQVFTTMAGAKRHTFQILTKRPERMEEYIGIRWGDGKLEPLPNVWLGTSVENQAAADERIPHLLATPAAVRFLSCEPLLGPINLTRLWLPDRSGYWNALDGRLTVKATGVNGNSDFWVTTEKPITGSVGWAIAGGESGPGARPMEIEWPRSLLAQCKAAGVAFFMKQLGAFVVDRNDRPFEAEYERWAEGPNAGQPTDPKAWPTPVYVIHDLDGTRDGYQGAPVRVVLNDKKGGDMDEWPHDLRVREFPKGT